MDDKKTILIIDDSNTNVVLLEAILTTKGFKAVTALTVKEAMSFLQKNKPDLILLDLLMPEISGFDFLEKMRSMEELNDIPVIVVSALTDEMNKNKTKNLGAVEFIEKPVNINGLVDIVQNTLHTYET
ncbi:MAG: response regulator [Bacteroidota bacterium]